MAVCDLYGSAEVLRGRFEEFWGLSGIAGVYFVLYILKNKKNKVRSISINQ